jgi:hypothetical protein
MMPIYHSFLPRASPRYRRYDKIISLKARYEASSVKYLPNTVFAWGIHHQRCLLYTSTLSSWGREERLGKVKGGDKPMADLFWQEAGVLLASGAIGSLLVYGYQNWLKR